VVDSSGYVSFAGTNYRAGNAWRRHSVQVAILAGSVQMSCEGQVRMEFAYDGGGLAKRGAVRLYLDGEQIGEGRLPATVPLTFPVDETADLGRDTASPVSDDYTPEGSTFSGVVDWV
jgi:hypothetical protein